jgi:diguanylate cyclase (GGDEF)-like protein
MDAQTNDKKNEVTSSESSSMANARSQGDRQPHRPADIALAIGFAITTILLFVVVGFALYELDARSTRLNALAASGNQIVTDGHAMRRSVEERAASLERIAQVKDAYERSVEVRRFFSLARVYDEALVSLEPQIDDDRMQQALAKVEESYDKAEKASEKTVSLLRTDELLERITNSAAQAAEAYHAVLPKIDALLQTQHDRTASALVSADVAFAEKRRTFLIASGGLLLLIALLGTQILRGMIRRARQLSWGAHHDALTGLLNRQELELRIDRSLESAKDRGARHCVLYLDLSGHKQISDNCGHKAFDEMLRQVALLLQSKIRSRDSLARLDGTLFAVMLENCEGDKGVEIAGDLVEAIQEFRFGWKGKSYNIESNFGVIEINAESKSADRVVDLADSAHRSSKQLGPNRVHRSALDDASAAHKHSDGMWAKRIKQGLDDQRFELHYQEIKPLGRTAGEQRVEVFIRLRDDENKLVAPRIFLGAAVNAGLVGDLDRWVLTHAITWLKDEAKPNTRVSVNISAQSMTDKRFPGFIQQLLKQKHVDAKRLCLEITESTALDNLAKATEFIKITKSIGCEVALDNFGRGLSSFDHLRKLPANYVKIDGPMVNRMTRDRVDFAVVKAIHRIAHALGMKTVAQFVESEKAQEKLTKIGVDYAQGYHICEPAPLSELSGVINTAGAA